MVKVTFSNNFKRGTEIVDDNTTPREILEAHEIDYTHGMTTIDSVPLQIGELDKSFAELGVREKCFLANVAKADNA